MRIKYKIRTSWPTTSKYISMMSCTNVLKVKSMANFFTEAFKLRSEKLNRLADV